MMDDNKPSKPYIVKLPSELPPLCKHCVGREKCGGYSSCANYPEKPDGSTNKEKLTVAQKGKDVSK